jgi:hypothetical protein
MDFESEKTQLNDQWSRKFEAVSIELRVHNIIDPSNFSEPMRRS